MCWVVWRRAFRVCICVGDLEFRVRWWCEEPNFRVASMLYVCASFMFLCFFLCFCARGAGKTTKITKFLNAISDLGQTFCPLGEKEIHWMKKRTYFWKNVDGEVARFSMVFVGFAVFGIAKL